ncbi:MAG: hypothetical protein ACRCY4_02430 [Brevinema sp.]
MAKKLISLKNVQELCANGSTEICIDSSLILTPSAQDYLKTKGITVRSSASNVPSKESASSKEELIKRISEILIQQHGLRDQELISKIIMATLQRIK